MVRLFSPCVKPLFGTISAATEPITLGPGLGASFPGPSLPTKGPSAAMNVTQCRMARAALGWTLDDLADASRVGRRTVAKFEAGGTILPEKLEALRAAFVREGIAFTNGGKRAGVSYLRAD